MVLVQSACHGLRDAGAVERRVLDACQVLQRLCSAHVDAGRIEAILDDAHQPVGQHADSHVPAYAGFAGVEQGPELDRQGLKVRKARSTRQRPRYTSATCFGHRMEAGRSTRFPSHRRPFLTFVMSISGYARVSLR